MSSTPDSWLRGVALGCVFAFFAGAADAACTDSRVDLRGKGGTVSFAVEIADEPEERMRGLMFRESMPQFNGMLFLWEEPAARSFWMRNTLLPLDIIFVDGRGVVQHVHENAIPGDETGIPSRSNDITAVLEINAGLSELLGLAPGTELRHPAFAEDAAWPCPG
ncbi:MAG: DUF192 domain-containing protein [Pseudomonadota bacterium]